MYLYLFAYPSASLTKCNECGLLSFGQAQAVPLKSRRDERPQTGVLTPGNCATTKEVLKGRQRHKQFDMKQVMYSVALSGLSFANALVRGLHPRLWSVAPSALFPGQQ